MLSNLNATTNIAPPYSPRIRSPSPFANRSIPFEVGDPEQTIMGKRFPGVGKIKPKKKKRHLTVIHQAEPRSHSVDRVGSQKNSEDIKRIRSVQSLTESEDGKSEKGNKISNKLKAMRFLPKTILLKKIPKLRSKFNSDSSTVEGDDSEGDSLSDWSQRETRQEETKKKGKYYHRAQSDSAWYGLDRVVEDKETTATPPSTKREDASVNYLYQSGRSKYNRSSDDSSLSDSSSSEDTSIDSSNQPTPTIHSNRKKSLSKVLAGKYTKRKSPKKQKNNEEYSRNKLKIPSAINNPKKITKPEINSNLDKIEHDLACPKINIVCYDQEEKACSLSAPLSTGSLMSPIHKSKSATALIDYPSHECESALSSALIAPDYKEHGPCLIPSSRNDAEVERIASGTPGSASHPPISQSAAMGRASHSPAKVSSVPCIHRRSSDSDLSITPKGNYIFK